MGITHVQGSPSDVLLRIFTDRQLESIGSSTVERVRHLFYLLMKRKPHCTSVKEAITALPEGHTDNLLSREDLRLLISEVSAFNQVLPPMARYYASNPEGAGASFVKITDEPNRRPGSHSLGARFALLASPLVTLKDEEKADALSSPNFQPGSAIVQLIRHADSRSTTDTIFNKMMKTLHRAHLHATLVMDHRRIKQQIVSEWTLSI